jgi:hypothetical protein
MASGMKPRSVEATAKSTDASLLRVRGDAKRRAVDEIRNFWLKRELANINLTGHFTAIGVE